MITLQLCLTKSCWIEIFEERPDDFSSLFRRILSMTLDRTLSTTLRTQLLCFLIHAFQSLDCTIVRKECAPLVSIGIWHNLHSEKRQEAYLDSTPHLRKAWRAAQKRYDAADEATKARLRFERSWLYTLVLDFINQLYDEGKSGTSQAGSEVSARMLKPMLQTRRFSTVKDLQSSSVTCKASCQRGATSMRWSKIYILPL